MEGIGHHIWGVYIYIWFNSYTHIYMRLILKYAHVRIHIWTYYIILWSCTSQILCGNVSWQWAFISVSFFFQRRWWLDEVSYKWYEDCPLISTRECHFRVEKMVYLDMCCLKISLAGWLWNMIQKKTTSEPLQSSSWALVYSPSTASRFIQPQQVQHIDPTSGSVSCLRPQYDSIQ